jgi:RNA polymerase-binding protein DksA
MSEHLDQAQLDVLEESLRRRHAELRRLIREELLRSDAATYGELAGQVHDAEEQAVADLLVDLELDVVDRHVNELRDVEAALKRMRSGSYGICEDTGEPIPFERLRAQPTARRTVTAQAAYERAHGQSDYPSL